MAQELVLLSDVRLDADTMADVARRVIPDGMGVCYLDGEITQFLDADRESVLTVFDPVPVHDATEAAAQLFDPPDSFGLWTEIIIPFASVPVSGVLAEAFASAVGGVLKVKR